MLAFFHRAFKDKRISLLIYSISAVVFLEMYVALFPTLKDKSGELEALMKAFPADMFKAFNIDSTQLSFKTLESHIAMEYISFIWPFLAIFFAVSLANYISVNEVERGTSETLISLPATRFRIFFERYLSGLLGLSFFTAVSIYSAIPLAKIHNIKYVINNYHYAFWGSLMFVFAVYSLATLISVIFSEKGRASLVTGGVIVLMYVLNVISSLKDSLKNLEYVSFFHYYNGSTLLTKATFVDYSIIVFLGLGILFTLLAAIIFKRRDLSV